MCGTKYHHCDSCRVEDYHRPWLTICDTEQHYKLFRIVKDFSDGNISKYSAVKELKKIGVEKKNISEYKENIQNILNEIFSDKNIESVDEEINENL